jgi:hypothetical protein
MPVRGRQHLRRKLRRQHGDDIQRRWNAGHDVHREQRRRLLLQGHRGALARGNTYLPAWVPAANVVAVAAAGG